MDEINKLPRGTRGAKEDNPDYIPVLESVSDETRELLEGYAKIPPDEVIPHCMRIRDAGWEVWPFPCIGRFRFLSRSINVCKEYPEIVDRIKKGQTLLDLGCCFGQDVRRLAADGVPTSNIYGSDISLEYLNLGYDLFRDKDTLETTFFAADVFDTSDKSPLNKYAGFFDIIHASSFFHLFDYEHSTKAAIRALKLLKHQPGSMIIGRQVGVPDPGEQTYEGHTLYAHNEESLAKFWRELTEQNGFKAEVYVHRDFMESAPSKRRPDAFRLRYGVRLV